MFVCNIWVICVVFQIPSIQAELTQTRSSTNRQAAPKTDIPIATSALVGGGPPDRHANTPDELHSRKLSITVKIVISVAVTCGLAVTLVTVWIVRRRKRNRHACLSGQSHIVDMSLIMETGAREAANTDATITAPEAEPDSQSPNRPEENKLRFVAGDDRISALDGGFVWDRLGRYVLYIPPQGSGTPGVISVSCCELGVGKVLTLSEGTQGVAISPQLRLEPDGFKYNKPVHLFLRINDDACIPDHSQLSLWYKTNESTQYTRFENRYCRVIQTGHHQYFTCWITHHSDVVLCKEVPCQTWQACAGVYAGMSSDGIRNLHVLLADNPKTVEVCWHIIRAKPKLRE